MGLARNVYSIVTYLTQSLIWIPGMFDCKLRKGSTGRSQSLDIIKSAINPKIDKVIWMHVASLGEFEQGRPVLERLRKTYPNHKILLSFFSPSGYEPRKDYEHVDVVCYLPLDTPRNARRFVSAVNPELVIFVKYEFWPNYLKEIQSHKCKAILISTVIQGDNGLLKHQRSWFVDMMDSFDHILTQDQSTYDVLNALDLQSTIQVSGDTRIDRTLSIAAAAEELPNVEQFCAESDVLIAGSTWPQDEANLLELYQSREFADWKLIIAPHDVSAGHVDQIMNRFAGAVRYSSLESGDKDARILVIDNIGLLNKIYRYGRIAYIGGGFGSGIHNTLEPAAFSLPIIIGPKHQKFVEAKQLVSSGGAFAYSSGAELLTIFHDLQEDSFYTNACIAVLDYMEDNSGATDDVIEVVEQLNF